MCSCGASMLGGRHRGHKTLTPCQSELELDRRNKLELCIVHTYNSLLHNSNPNSSEPKSSYDLSTRVRLLDLSTQVV